MFVSMRVRLVCFNMFSMFLFTQTHRHTQYIYSIYIIIIIYIKNDKNILCKKIQKIKI